ncbi:MAG: nitrile hydratase accessory protein [Burkholderiaceae bacterium]|nr:nitrile hydratase accessory protein [Burkholderiaceae bacterium]
MNPGPDLSALPGLRLGDDGPIFGEPWQAQAFALVLALHERGAFSWPEWAAALTAAIRDAQAQGDPDDGRHYWQHWLNALESLVLARGLGDAAQLQALATAWAEAAERTPHGQPIVLEESDRARLV